MAGLSALALFASCNKEAERPASLEGEVVTATFTVAAPEGVATKAISDGSTATNLIVAVYDETDKYLEALSTHAIISGGTPTWNVSMKVVKDMTYRFVFIAKSASDNGFSTFTPADGKLAINYSAVPANSDNADFFFVQDRFKVENSFSKTEEMHRPLAQVNFGASDLAAAAYSIKTDNMKTGVTLKGIYSEMSVLTGEETGAAGNVTFTQADRVPTEDPKFVDGYDRIAMVYALVAKENQSNVTATLNVTAKGAKNDDNHPITREIANVPLKRNYRTNILGNIFTNDFNFTVNTVPGFYTSDSNKLIGPSFASVADLNAYFATFTDNADNGDVNPEVVTLTAFEASEASAATITLPKYNATPVRIRITAAYSGTLTLAYADADADKPATVELYAPNMSGATLNGTITSTHLTILEGSHIGTSTVSTSDTTLEIRPTATVGTVKIVKGNANIQGNVENVEVLSGATAVAGTPVQVFVAKEAAIETITLNAKSDVVVEQPKDHIDVEATEKKIAVYVKEGADNSTAKAQHGGVIYVKAEVPCTVTADGTSEAEDGSAVSSTVIIDSGAAGSTVTAENGGAINLTANGNCEVTASGSSTPEDPTETPVPSTVMIAEVGTGATVYTETSEGGEVEEAPDAEIHGDVFAYVALNVNTEVQYISLKAAIDAASAGDTIKMTDNSTEENQISLTKKAIIDLNGYTITFKGYSETLSEKFPNNAAFYVASGSEADLTIYSSKKDDLENTIKGAISLNLLVQRSAGFFGNGTMTMRDIVLTKENTAKQCIYVENGKAILDNLSVTAIGGAGGIYLADNVIGKITNCVINQSGNGSSPWLSSALAISDGAKIEVAGCALTGVVPFFIFNSGGEATLKNSSFTWIPGGSYGQKDIYLEYGTSTYDAIVYIYNDCVLSLGYDAIATPVGYSPYSSNAYVWSVNAIDDALIVNKATELQYALAHECPLLQLGEGATGNFVNGGVFNNDPSAHLAEGYFATYDSTTQHWTVVSDPGYIFENDVVTIYAAHGLSYVSNNYADFRDAGHNLTIKLSEDIDMTGCPFRSFEVNDYTSADKNLVLFTFDGQNKTITGLEKMLISKTWAGHSSFEVKNLTLEDANIVEDENDANENVGVGAICGWAEASSSCKIINVSLLNSSVIGGHWTGGLVGYATGYDDPDNGPVLEKFTVENCTVERCTIKGKGSVGALVAHAAGNNATLWEVENFTSKDNTLLNTASKTDRTGALIGTLGLTTGSSTAYPESKVGVYFTSPLTVSGNTVNGVPTDAKKIGRKGSSDDNKCYLDNVDVVDAWLAN